MHCLLLFLSKGFVNDKVQTLLDTMTEISSILYARSEDRCQRSILRLHNQAFIQAIACQEVIGMPQILSQKKVLWLVLPFHNSTCSYPARHNQPQVNQYRAARTPLQCLFQYLSNNIQKKARGDYYPWDYKNAG